MSSSVMPQNPDDSVEILYESILEDRPALPKCPPIARVFFSTNSPKPEPYLGKWGDISIQRQPPNVYVKAKTWHLIPYQSRGIQTVIYPGNRDFGLDIADGSFTWTHVTLMQPYTVRMVVDAVEMFFKQRDGDNGHLVEPGSSAENPMIIE
ncbi:hypothetical protein H0H81_002435 [Sphagnurus paluster]|uniref:Uncharacterized protein n=1 Tax=Sphagnurus paluster TaxID=117069 RepID=A0A9P7GGS9_9AGAR|nr:hypothetical protein H0H81_002435 [Sphagnurus paluster]